MLSLWILASALFAYWLGHYETAFWATVFNMLNGSLALLVSVINPDWYAAKRAEAGLPLGIDLHPEIGALVVAKIFAIGVNATVAWYFGRAAGYF